MVVRGFSLRFAAASIVEGGSDEDEDAVGMEYTES